MALTLGVVGGVTIIEPRVLNPWSGRTNDKDGIKLAVLNPWN